MRGGGFVRILLPAVLLLATTACVPDRNMSPWTPWSGGPGHLALSNFRFDHADVEAVISAAPDCSPAPGAAPVDFDLPFKGTRVIQAAPDTDVCWRRQIGGGQWTDWNRAFTASGRSIDAQL
jgi:hypothetical protein